MARHRSDDKLAQFSYWIFLIKFVIFEAVMLGCFLYVLYHVARHELGF